MDVTKFNLLGEEINVKDEIARKGFLKNKKIICYGDSTAALPNSYINKLITNYNIDITNNAISGHSLVEDYTTILADEFANYDIVILNYGINDWLGSASLRVAYESTNIGFLTALDKVLQHISEKDKLGFVILPWYCVNNSFSYGINSVLCTLDGYIDGAIDICNKYKFPYINLWKSSGINSYNYNRLMEDSGNIFVHALEPVITRVADLIYNGCINNGKCFENLFDNTIMFLKNGYENYNEIETSINSLTNKVTSGYNIRSFNNINPITSPFGFNDEDDFLIVSGCLVFLSDISMYIGRQGGNETLIKYISTNDFKHSVGHFRFSIPLKEFYNNKIYFKIQTRENENGCYLLGTHFYTTKTPTESFFSDGSSVPYTLKQGSIANFSSIKKATFLRNGFIVPNVAISNITQGTVLTLKDHPRTALDYVLTSNKNGGNYGGNVAFLYASGDLTYQFNSEDLYISSFFVETCII